MGATDTSLANLITETASLLGDPAGNRWLQAVAAVPSPSVNPIQWELNEGVDAFALATGVYRVSLAVTVATGTATISVTDANGNPPFGPILRLEDQNNRTLRPATTIELNNLVSDYWRAASADTPQYYIRDLDGFGTARLWPPSSAAATYTAYVASRPTPMSAPGNYPFTDLPQLTVNNPAQYHFAFPYYAAWKLLLFNRTGQDIQTAQLYKQQFDAVMQNATQAVAAIMA